MSVNIVVLTRGDTEDIRLNVGEFLTEHPGYKISFYFGIMKPDEPFETAGVRRRYELKDLEGSILHIHLDADTTFSLEPGTYYYSIKAKSGDYVETLINRTKFVVNPS